jgi:hypothetical protein
MTPERPGSTCSRSAGSGRAGLSSRGLAGSIVDPGPYPVSARPSGPTTSLPFLAEDLEASGCLTLLVPSTVIRRCPGTDESWTAAPGALVADRPVGRLRRARRQSLLVAAGTDWAQPDDGLAVPSPEASGAIQASRWRTRPSAPFALQVVDAARLSGDAAGGATDDVGIDPTAIAGSVASVGLSSNAGDRLFVRVVSAPAESTAPDPATIAPEPVVDRWSSCCPQRWAVAAVPAAGRPVQARF